MADTSNPTAPISIDAQSITEMLDDQPLRVDMRARGTTGLNHVGGYINENNGLGLEGRQGIRVFAEMGETDPGCALILFLVQNTVRSVKWYVQAASEKPEDQHAADLIESAMHDMTMPFDDVIAEQLSFIQFGFSLHEIVYKQRAGDNPHGWLNSKYADGLIGWRSMPIRAQDTIDRWEFDDADDLIGAIQFDPYATGKGSVYLPLEKCMLFRTTSYKNNPQGTSAFKRAFRPYHFKRALEAIEAIGIERDLAGMPVVWVPQQIMSPNASQENKRMWQSFRDIVTKVRRNELEGIMMPLVYDDKGNKLFDIQLMASAGTRQFDLTKSIDRLNKEIFRSALAQFLLLGSDASAGGSWALSTDMTNTFLLSLRAYLRQIINVWNDAIKRLIKLNGLQLTDYPTLQHSNIQQVDLKTLSDAFKTFTDAGVSLTPDEDVDRHIADILGMPHARNTEKEARQNVNTPAHMQTRDMSLPHVHDDEKVETDGPSGKPSNRPVRIGGQPKAMGNSIGRITRDT